MRFFKISGPDEAIAVLRERLHKELGAGKHVLWLVSGGSNIKLSVKVMEQLPAELTARLHIMLTDERFGPPGHKDSNFQQLLDAGFKAKQAILIPVLQNGLDFEQTAVSYAEEYASQEQAADIVIAQFGMGPDGHIAGMLPHSPAVLSADLVCAYQASDYQRLTLTAEAFETIDVSYLMVAGEDKQAALETLHDEEMSFADQPAQILKLFRESYVYNDYIAT